MNIKPDWHEKQNTDYQYLEPPEKTDINEYAGFGYVLLHRLHKTDGHISNWDIEIRQTKIAVRNLSLSEAITLQKNISDALEWIKTQATP